MLVSQYIIPFEQRFEGQDLQHLLYGTSQCKKFTLSFHIKSQKLAHMLWKQGMKARLVKYGDNLKVTTISSANTWERKQLLFLVDTNDDIENDNAGQFTLFWWMIAGSTLQVEH